MFKRLVNECTIELTLHPQGAMLIKSGLAQMSGIDMAWVRVYRNGRRVQMRWTQRVVVTAEALFDEQ